MIVSSSGRRTQSQRLRLIIALLLVILIVVVVAFGLAQIHPLQSYLVAARPLAAGTILTSDSVVTRDLDPDSMPPGAVLAQAGSSVYGQEVVIPFAAGDIITSSHLSNSSGRVAGDLPPTLRILKLPTKNIVMPDGLQPGDKIDMVLSIHEASDLETIYAIQGLTIRAIAPDASSITVGVTPAVAQLLIQSLQIGQLFILAAPPNEQFVVLPPVTTTQNCQITIGPDGQPTIISGGSTTCPNVPGGTSPGSTTPTPTPSASPSPTPKATP
jgi:Flp pilus assembly protein CpaB